MWGRTKRKYVRCDLSGALRLRRVYRSAVRCMSAAPMHVSFSMQCKCIRLHHPGFKRKGTEGFFRVYLRPRVYVWGLVFVVQLLHAYVLYLG